MKNTELTIDDKFIRYHQLKTLFKAEKTITVFCRDIQKMVLSNYSLGVTLKNTMKQKFRLPHYNRSRFSSIEVRLEEWASENKIPFKTKRWWKGSLWEDHLGAFGEFPRS